MLENPSAKHHKGDSSSESSSAGPSYFEPAGLMKTKEGTARVSSHMRNYLDKYMRNCLTKEEREALFKEHPRPDLDSCTPLKVDRFMSEYLGKRMPKDQESELLKIQSAVLAIVRPLTTAWQQLADDDLEKEPEMVVPAAEVLAMIECTLCLVGNSSNITDQEKENLGISGLCMG